MTARARATLYETVADRVASLVERGALRAGQRVPSVRETSAQQHVSIATVVHAYALLESRGILEARPQSGHYVRAKASAAAEPRACRPAMTPKKVTNEELALRVCRALSDPSFVPLGAALPAPALLPHARLAVLSGRIAREAGARLSGYERPDGSPALRRQIARRSIDAGCALRAGDVITTVGAMEALHLCLRATTKPGDTVALEAPTYFGLVQLIASLGLTILEIPVHPRGGMDLDVLEAATGTQRIAACLATPNFNNPAGALMTDDAKKRLVTLLGRRQIPLIEDDIYGDLGFSPGRPRPAKAWDDKGLVLLCSSFSKTLAPSLRVGWTAPGVYRDRVEALKFAQTVASPTLPQLTIASFLETGAYDRHLRALRRRLADQVSAFGAAIAESFPKGTRISRPEGGFVLWIELPPGTSGLELHLRAYDRKISVAPGAIFSSSPSRFASFVRISCGSPFTPEIARAVRTVGALATDLAAHA